MAKAKEPIAIPEPEPHLHLTGPKAQADKLKGLGIGDEVTLTVRGTIRDLHMSEYETRLGMAVEGCEISKEHVTLSSAVEKSARKRSGYAG